MTADENNLPAMEVRTNVDAQLARMAVGDPAGANDAVTKQAMERYVESKKVPEYELPVANPDTLGGVQPVEKTEGMTNPVGVDELGGLWCAGGSSEWKLIRSDTLEQDVKSLTLNIGEDWDEVLVIISSRVNDAENSLTSGIKAGYVSLNGIKVANNSNLFYPRETSVYPTTIHLRRMAEIVHSETIFYGGSYYGTSSGHPYFGATRRFVNAITIGLHDADLYIKAGAVVEVWSK
jgi:hypothetical protein